MKLSTKVGIVTIMGMLFCGTAMSADISAEYRAGSNNASQYDIQANGAFNTNTFLGTVKVGAESETTNPNGDVAPISQLFAVSGGLVRTWHDFTLVPYVEYGVNLNSDAEDQQFYGVGATVSHPLIYDTLMGEVGYRYRDAFTGADANQGRWSASLAWAINESNAVGASYYYNYGDNDTTNQGGVFYRYSF